MKKFARTNESPARKSVRLVLGSFLAFATLNAVGGGIYGLTGAPGVPNEWLQGSPFTTYFVPSLVLLLVVGGAFLFSSFAVLSNKSFGPNVALAAGVVAIVWIAVQVAIIGYRSWMQPTTLAAGVVISLVAILYPRIGTEAQ
jgi:hypothetical protein